MSAQAYLLSRSSFYEGKEEVMNFGGAQLQ